MAKKMATREEVENYLFVHGIDCKILGPAGKPVETMTERKVHAQEHQMLTTAGWLEQTDQDLAAIQELPLSDVEHGFVRAVGSLRQACLEMASDIARLKEQHR